MAKTLTWPNGKKIAVSVTVMFETWADESAPNYSVQTTKLKQGTVDYAAKAWATYGGRVGVWRIVRLLDRLQIPGTFFVNARCVEQYPDAVRQIARSGHDIAAHSYTHDALLSDMTPEEQRAMVRKCVDMLSGFSSKPITGWASPVVAFTPETSGVLALEGLKWTTDITYVDLPLRIRTEYGDIAGVPTTDFSDNRVLKANVRDLFDVYKGTFDYLEENEPMGLLVMVMHCQFGGRPLVSAVIEEILRYMRRSPNVWFARHEELAQWALDSDVDEHTYKSRFFD